MNYFGASVINGFRSQTPRGFYDSVKGHTGVDIGTPVGTALSLPIGCTVASVKTQHEMGLTMYLKDSVGNVLVFAHLSEALAKVGETVKPNEVFAKTGNSGSATTGPHLHFELIGKQPDPGFEMMSRTLGEFVGYNLDPVTYLNHIFSDHWAKEAWAWARRNDIITQDHNLDGPMTWGAFAMCAKRLVEQIQKGGGK
jgi:murein DD-endopeptidase MepM/ murein hydrolase activator NlpD